MDVQEYLRELAQVNRNGFGFLLAYGSTWLAAAVLGWRFGERVGTYAALFQGMVGLPLGLLLTAAAADGPRPQDASLNSLSIYLSMGQLLILPLVIVLVTLERYTVAVAALAVTLAVHFVPYSWLYSTPIYIVVAAVVAVGTAVLIARKGPDRATGGRICALTGAALILGGLAALSS
ncbi:hypothetical protein GA707_20225 [Nostocoides sp. F2B08]|uniref:DUF7010 family protein n=1 Tax=Nostocoides sp. F2B08 TaxID=2653936 RepID=UPI001263C7AB|nr:hypothetical protein [Tetrasphaera sp. F2B08]KAB7739574.1 hypothetical protein GA707_20225 [Tetrasphaera sp. F2B08]